MPNFIILQSRINISTYKPHPKARHCWRGWFFYSKNYEIYNYN